MLYSVECNEKNWAFLFCLVPLWVIIILTLSISCHYSGLWHSPWKMKENLHKKSKTQNLAQIFTNTVISVMYTKVHMGEFCRILSDFFCLFFSYFVFSKCSKSDNNFVVFIQKNMWIYFHCLRPRHYLNIHNQEMKVLPKLP